MSIRRQRPADSEVAVGLHGLHRETRGIHGVLNLFPGDAALHRDALAGNVKRNDAIETLQVESDSSIQESVAAEIVRSPHQADRQISLARLLQNFANPSDGAGRINRSNTGGVDAARVDYAEVWGLFLDFVKRALEPDTGPRRHFRIHGKIEQLTM